MKKITLFYLFVLSSVLLNAQQLNWSTPIKTNNAKEVVEYIGSTSDNNYFISYNLKVNMFYEKLETYIIKTDSKNELLEKSERVIFEETELVKAFIKDNKINLLIKQYEKGSYVVELVVFDAKTLKEVKNESKILVNIEVEKSEKVIVYYAESRDKSKYCLNYLAVDKKTNKGYLQMNVFEYDNTPLWTNKFDNDFEGTLNIHDFHIENSGDVYLYATNKIPITKKTADYKLVVIKNGEDGGRESEFSIASDQNISSMSFHVLDSNTVFLATHQDRTITIYKLDLEQEDIVSYNTFKVYDEQKDDFSWQLAKFYQLENGNLVLPVENRWITKYISNTGDSYTYTNSQLSFISINSEENKVISKTFITRRMSFSSKKFLSHGYFESPYYFTDANDFYAIYNNGRGFDDLKGTGPYLTFEVNAKGSKKFHTLMLKIDELGKVKLDKLFSMKKDKRMFSAYTSFFNQDNELIISGGNVKGFSFMKYNYK
ncbi:MAG: hypothetical protein WCR29_05485 [Bacteroidales bacterium]|nr:hypothetical protein [Bacteroidales bacterium]